MRNAILIGITILAPLVCLAADYKPLDVKLGLWESTVTTKTTGTPPMPPELLSRLTPEQRAKMEAAMKANAARAAQPKTNRSCLTKEQLNKGLTFGSEGASSACNRTIVTSNASEQDLRFECNEATHAMKASGTMHVEAVNSETVKGAGQGSTTDGTHTMNVQMSFSAKWISADCGALGQK